MATVAERIALIEAAPDGPGVGAFFDYDGTVIGGFSAAAFYRHRIRRMEIGPLELVRTLLASTRGIHDADDFGEFLELSLSAWAGRTEEEIEQLGRSLFKHEIAARLHHEVWQLIEAHRRKSHTVVLASSATRYQVVPMAEEIGADHVLCTPVESVDGIITGRAGGRPLWGAAKGEAAAALAAEHEIDLDASFAYSNGAEDVPFLEIAGNPLAVAPDDGLRKEARLRDWPILNVRSPQGGTIPSPVDIARTIGFYGSFGLAAGAGIGIGLLNRSREMGVDITGGVGSDIGLALAGIDVKIVRGAEHLWSHRPAVFTINHQSKLDPIIVMHVLRGGFTGVAKKEAKRVPFFGQLFMLAGAAFVDRTDHGKAREALEPAVAKVRDERYSLAIAPEGTRTPTPRLGPFKKGPFHIAMQAGVPMVPIVIRNAGEVMWRGAQLLRGGTVEIVVLAPIDTSKWTAKTVSKHVAQVRDMYVETLANWPERE